MAKYRSYWTRVMRYWVDVEADNEVKAAVLATKIAILVDGGEPSRAVGLQSLADEMIDNFDYEDLAFHHMEKTSDE